MTRIQRSWQAVTALVVAASLAGQLAIVLSRDGSVVNYLSYFTIESNLLVLACALLLLAGRDIQATWFRLLRLASLTGITVTFVVFSLLIGPHLDLSGADWWVDKGLHYVSPALAIVGFVWVGPRPVLRWTDLTFMVWPVVWLGHTFMRAAWFSPLFLMPDGSSANVPYQFLDVDRLGTGRVIATSIGITVLLIAVAAAYITLARRQTIASNGSGQLG